MSVGEGKVAGAIVKRSGKILPIVCVCRAKHWQKPAVVNTVWVFVQQSIGVRRPVKICHAQKNLVTIRDKWLRTNKRIHGKAPYPQSKSGNVAVVRWTMINIPIFRIFPDGPLEHQG